MMLATHTDPFEEILVEDFEAADALRSDRIRTARRRITEGWYDREALLNTVVEAIIEDMAPRR